MSHEDADLTILPRSSIGDRREETDLARELRIALASFQPAACESLAIRAGESRDHAAAPFLRDILAMRRRRWGGARLAAVHALAQIGGEHVCFALARALFDPEPVVQQAASEALVAHGPDALPALHAILNESSDWPLSGMKRLISTMSRLQTPHATGALTAIVLAGLPIPPARWDRPLLYSIRVTTALVLGGAALCIILSGNIGVGVAALFAFAILGAFLWFLFSLFVLLPYRAVREAAERNAIAGLAADGLRLAADKAYLPALIEGAFGYNRMSPRPARRALRYVLTRVGEEDRERLPFGAQSKLMDALDRGHGAEMDLAILGALEWVGPGSIAGKVARMAERSNSPAVREEAKRILPVLLARQQQEQAPKTLLRASQLTSPTNQLLRPSLSVEATPAEQLLRPGNTE